MCTVQEPVGFREPTRQWYIHNSSPNNIMIKRILKVNQDVYPYHLEYPHSIILTEQCPYQRCGGKWNKAQRLSLTVHSYDNFLVDKYYFIPN